MEFINSSTGSGRKMIKVLLLDDSRVALNLIKKMLSVDPDIKVVGTANNGLEGLRLIPELEPDVICTDLYMPVMDGLEFTKEVMARYPRPILVVSVSVQKEDAQKVFKIIEAGAVDVFAKPRLENEAEYLHKASELASKIRILSGVRVFRRGTKRPVSDLGKIEIKEVKLKIIAVGASTGGPQALQNILAGLPKKFPLPIVCVQHIGEGFLQGLITWLKSLCELEIEIAGNAASPMPGTVYFPPENTHLLVDDNGRFKYSSAPPFHGHRPSITVVFDSIAKCFGKSSLAVLLTGMGDDGALGMKSISDSGGITVVQDKNTSIVFSMPNHAIELKAARYVLPLDAISSFILEKSISMQ